MAAVQRSASPGDTTSGKNPRHINLGASTLHKSPHAQLCDVLVQLRNLTLDPCQDVYRSNPPTSSNGKRDLLPTHRGHEEYSTGPALAQYESLTPAPLELVKIHNSEIRPILDALLPKREEDSTAQHENHVLTEEEMQLDFLKLVAYGATNNFAGMDNPAWRAMTFRSLKTVLSPIMQSQAQDLSLRRNISQLQSLKPMAETFFRCAVESGDHHAVAQLLGWSEVKINVNNVVCTVKHTSLTPIEVAASLHNIDLVRVLLEHKADINRSLHMCPTALECRNCSAGGALVHACLTVEDLWTSETEESGLQENNLPLVALIIDAGGMICSETLRYIASIGGASLVHLFVNTNAQIPSCRKTFLEAGVFHEAVYRLDLAEQQHLLLSMRVAGIGLEYGLIDVETALDEPTTLDKPTSYPAHLIDIAAQRGQVNTVKLLQSWQVCFTESTLVAGIRSLDALLLQHLLQEGVPRGSFSNVYHTTPLAEAVRLQNPDLISQLCESPDCITVNCEASFCALLAAAAEIGDEVLLCQLLARGCGEFEREFERERILGYALTRACKSNHLAVARILLESGASTSRSHYTRVMGFERSQSLGGHCPCPLDSAAVNRNVEMLVLLLDHDIGDPDHISSQASCLTSIIEWGSLEAVELLLSAGFMFNNEENLVTAIQQGNEPLLELFLSRSCGDLFMCSRAIETAIRSGREASLTLLLESKSPCLAYEYKAFAAALQCSSHLYQVLLDKTFSVTPEVPLGTIDRSRGRFYDVWHGAIESRRLDVLHWLVTHVGVSPESPKSWTLSQLSEGHGWVALKAAIEDEEYTVLDFVISLGFNPDTALLDPEIFRPQRLCRLSDGSREPCESALIFAIKCKKAGMVQALLKYGANVNLPAQHSIKRTPLQQAAETGDLRIIELLFAAGADIKVPPAIRNGGTPIQLAAMQGFIGIVQHLEKHGDHLWASGSKVGGRTALEGAAEHGRFDMVHYLASRKPPDLEQYGKAKQYALKNGHGAIADMLEAMFQVRMAELQPAPPRLPVPSPTVRRRHICSTCTTSFTKASALRRHERAHQGTYAYRCSECDQGFRRKDTLDRHVESQHVGGCHQCHVCGDEFSRRDTLSQHIRSKHCEAAQVATASTTPPIALWA